MQLRGSSLRRNCVAMPSNLQLVLCLGAAAAIGAFLALCGFVAGPGNEALLISKPCFTLFLPQDAVCWLCRRLQR
jgi:hypothetical protein